MDKLDVLSSHSLTITSLRISLNIHWNMNVRRWLCLLNWLAILSWSPSLFNQKLLVIHIWWECRKRQTKKKTKKRFDWLCFKSKIKVQAFMWPHFIVLKSWLFERKVSYQEQESFDLICKLKNVLNISRAWKFIFENLHSFFHFSLLQGHDKRQQ